MLKPLYSSLFTLALLCSIQACIPTEDNNQTMIFFANVTGKYNGTSKICTSIHASIDTTCSNLDFNLLKIILFDDKNIIIQDENDVFGKNKLQFKDIKLENAKKVYNFESVDPLKNIVLTYAENPSIVRLSEQIINSNSIITNIFEGKE